MSDDYDENIGLKLLGLIFGLTMGFMFLCLAFGGPIAGAP